MGNFVSESESSCGSLLDQFDASEQSQWVVL